jgi:hypothetical protein
MLCKGPETMVTFSLKTRVQPDGNIQVVVQTSLPQTDVEVLLVVQPVSDEHEQASGVRWWPEGYFQRTFGCLADDPLVRPPQLNPERRENLL